MERAAVENSLGDVLSAKKDESKKLIQSLVKNIVEGDNEAFDRLYLYSIENLIKFLRIITSSQSDAEEMAQETFVYIWENRNKIDPTKNFQSFLYTVAKRTAFRYMAKKGLDRKYCDYKAQLTEEYEISPDELMANQELALMIALYVENMPFQRRRVFEMSRSEGKSIEEIASELNLSYNTVKNHLQASTKGLRKLITLFAILFIS